MRLTFRGWKREVVVHNHDVMPVVYTSTGYKSAGPGQPIYWSSPTHAVGRVNELGLSGDFLVDFEFHDDELVHWLRQKIKKDPLTTAKLLAKLQLEAVNNIED